MTLFMLAIIPAMMLAAVFFGRYIKRFSKQVQEKVAESNTIIEETLQGISNKAFTNEFFEIGRYTKKTNEVMQIAKKGGRYRGAFASFIIFCLFGSIVAVIWYGVLMINSNELSVGELFTFILYRYYWCICRWYSRHLCKTSKSYWSNRTFGGYS